MYIKILVYRVLNVLTNRIVYTTGIIVIIHSVCGFDRQTTCGSMDGLAQYLILRKLHNVMYYGVFSTTSKTIVFIIIILDS